MLAQHFIFIHFCHSMFYHGELAEFLHSQRRNYNSGWTKCFSKKEKIKEQKQMVVDFTTILACKEYFSSADQTCPCVAVSSTAAITAVESCTENTYAEREQSCLRSITAIKCLLVICVNVDVTEFHKSLEIVRKTNYKVPLLSTAHISSFHPAGTKCQLLIYIIKHHYFLHCNQKK